MTKIELLKSFAKGWFGNSQQHSIHAQLLKASCPRCKQPKSKFNKA